MGTKNIVHSFLGWLICVAEKFKCNAPVVETGIRFFVFKVGYFAIGQTLFFFSILFEPCEIFLSKIHVQATL